MSIVVDDCGIVREVTGARTSRLGPVVGSAAGHPLSEFVHPNDRERLVDALAALGTGPVDGTVAVALRLLDEKERSIWIKLETVPGEVGDADTDGSRQLVVHPYGPGRALGEDEGSDPNPYSALVQQSADIVMVVDPDGTVRFANPAMLRLLGMEPDDLLGTQVLEIIHAGDHDLLTDLVAKLLESPETPRSFELRARHVDGSYRWIDGWLQNLLDDVHVGGLLGNGRDVTDRRDAQEALTASEERFRSLTSSSPSAIFELDAAARVGLVNQRWVELTGRDLGEIDDVFGVLHPSDARRLRAVWSAEGAPSGLEERVRVVRPDGDFRWVELRTRPVHDSDGLVVAHVGTLHDVTEVQNAHRKLEHLASHDPLTGLPNRTLLLERLQLAVTAARETGDPLALLFVDLDRFKVVNDSLGHHAGDRVLVEVARRLGELVRPRDVVARFGGDEFVVLCAPLADDDQAVQLADRIRREVAGGVLIESEAVHVSVSVGVVIGSGEMDPETLLRNADVAMYAAKSQGRDRAQVFDEAMHHAAVERLTLEAALRQGIDRDEFEMYFQPIVDVATMRPSAVESLLRWKHPSRGLLEPDDFLTVAEESGILGEIGNWALEAACEAASGWRGPKEGEAPTLFVNLAPSQLADPDLVTIVGDVLRRTGLAPDRLMLEVTEGMLMVGPEATSEVLHGLRELGVRVAIDDFGTGYSSLSYLTRLPVDLLKIDRSFVAGSVGSANDREVISAIIALAHALGLTTVAEGVETEEQLELLRVLGCDGAQGFQFSPPVSGEVIESALATSGDH